MQNGMSIPRCAGDWVRGSGRRGISQSERLMRDARLGSVDQCRLVCGISAVGLDGLTPQSVAFVAGNDLAPNSGAAASDLRPQPAGSCLKVEVPVGHWGEPPSEAITMYASPSLVYESGVVRC